MRTCARPRRAQGSTLVEVMIAVFILSIGLLGLIGSQGAALWQHRLADAQITATHLAESYAEQARANLDGLRADAYAWQRVYQSGEQAIAPACSPGSLCSPVQIAQSQLAAWLVTVRGALPGGDAYVKTTSDKEYLEIWLMWKRGESSPASVSTDDICATEAIGHLAAPARPNCAFFRVKV